MAGSAAVSGVAVTNPPLARCTCDRPLREWQYTDLGGKLRSVWAESLADVVDYQARKPTRHDILDGRGRRLLRGRCGVAIPNGH
jgi:hypothetical protein